MAVRGVLEAMRSSSEAIRGEKFGDGGGGRRGWVVVVASGERAEAMRAWARAVEVGVGGQSMSVEMHQWGSTNDICFVHGRES